MNVGLIVACEDNILTALNEHTKLYTKKVGVYTVNGYQIGKNTVNVIRSGVGEICAASATQLLISAFGVESIINVGVVGALKGEYQTLTTFLVKDVVHYDFDTSEIDGCEKARYLQFDSVAIKTDEGLLTKAQSILKGVKSVRIASGDKFIGSPEVKKQLAVEYDADICDMESAGILITCKNNLVPCVMIKAVSDSVGGGAGEFNDLKNKAAEECLTLLKGLLGE